MRTQEQTNHKQEADEDRASTEENADGGDVYQRRRRQQPRLPAHALFAAEMSSRYPLPASSPVCLLNQQPPPRHRGRPARRLGRGLVYCVTSQRVLVSINDGVGRSIDRSAARFGGASPNNTPKPTGCDRAERSSHSIHFCSHIHFHYSKLNL